MYLLFSSLVVNKGRLVQTLKCLGTLLGLRQFMLHTLIFFTIFFKSVNKREGKRREERERKKKKIQDQGDRICDCFIKLIASLELGY